MFQGLGKYTTTASDDGPRIEARSDIGMSFPGMSSAGGGGTSMSATVAAKSTELPVLDGLINYLDPRVVRNICRDVYFNNPIAGATVDMMSALAFGEFSLTGIPTGQMMRTYIKTCERLRVMSSLPVISVDFLVDGGALALLGFNNQDKMFHSILPVDLNWVEIRPVGLFGIQPILNAKFPDYLRKTLQDNKDLRVQRVRELYPPMILQAILQNKVAMLAYESTVFMNRRTKGSHDFGLSIYNKMIPLWLAEKALTRGFIEGAYRRQRGLMDVTVGDEEWIPTNEQLRQVADSVKMAYTDPMEPVLAHRPGIMIQEQPSGENFWKVSDSADFFNSSTMRSLGVSDAFLSGDSSYNNAESAVTIFMQNVRLHRAAVARGFFYEHVFPYTAIINDFKRKDHHRMVTGDIELGSDEYVREMAQSSGQRVFKDKVSGAYTAIADGMNVGRLEEHNLDEYHQPQVVWHNNLRPEADQTYLQTLQELTKAGVPAPIRALAASGGVNVTDVLYSMDEDLAVRRKMRTYRDNIKEIDSDLEQNQEEMGGMPTGNTRAKLIARALGRNWDEDASLYGFDKGGRPKRLPKGERNWKNERLNRHLARAAAEAAERHNYLIRTGRITGPKRQ